MNDSSQSQQFSLLESINDPAELRQLDEEQLAQLCDELRQFLIHSISRTGGHLAAGLGVVELTVALHAVFQTPEDRIVWDVGHQAYPHKILTGRRSMMSRLRVKDGLSGFPRREESAYDTFGTGHSSTSISAALGMAIASRQAQDDRHAIAVIGDGALTGGMSFEALNHAGSINDIDLLVILNDNDMSISHPVGAVSTYLSRVLSSRFYNKVRNKGRSVLQRTPNLRDFADRWEEHMKGMMLPGTLWEELGFNYIGPVDGHDLPMLMDTLSNMRKMSGPRFLHVVTQKGKGYEHAEEKPVTFHGVTPFNPITGKLEKSTGGKSYTNVFSDWICAAARSDERLHAVTPAMCEGSGLVAFAEEFPQRYHDVGIAEQHALTFAGGMACEGLKPVVAIYSTFLQRAYDQLIHDIAIQNLPVLFAIDRAGLVGPDGATHAGSFDLSYLRCIPNMMIMAPADENECRQMLYTGFNHQGPCAIRYPRGQGPGTEIINKMTALPIGKGEIRRKGQSIALLSFGCMLETALDVGQQLNATVANMRFVKPLDEDLIIRLANSHDLLLTLEDNAVSGGAGSAVNEVLLANNLNTHIINMGLPDTFQEHGSRGELLADAGLTTGDIMAQIKEFRQQPLAKHVTLA